MNWLAQLRRSAGKLRFRLLGLATIKDIPAARFQRLIEELRADGWRVVSTYDGFDAWIDYGSVRLRKGRHVLSLEWDNWTEGSVEGRRAIIGELSARTGLPACGSWRWS